MVFPILFLWGVLELFISLKHLSTSALDQGKTKTILAKFQSSRKGFSLLVSYFDTSTKFIFCHWSSKSDSMDYGRHGHWEQVTLRATSKRQSRARCSELCCPLEFSVGAYLNTEQLHVFITLHQRFSNCGMQACESYMVREQLSTEHLKKK